PPSTTEQPPVPVEFASADAAPITTSDAVLTPTPSETESQKKSRRHRHHRSRDREFAPDQKSPDRWLLPLAFSRR
ncbi:MAG TPA: hypothetical protein VGQ99_12535, partial [Tepidisphaeraceae bacterium]|nr:hypothetical protein [Tepidisphaeraceae bacterium]